MKLKVENLIKDFLEQKKFAVIGSFRNESKYAYRILKVLKVKTILITLLIMLMITKNLLRSGDVFVNLVIE